MDTSHTPGTAGELISGIPVLVAVYAAVSALCILLSHRLATLLFPDPAWLARAQTSQRQPS